ALDDSVEPMSFRKAKDHIQQKYMVRLKGAPFNQEDPALGDPPMPCSKCPHRTGNMRALFADVDSADVCTNPPCFAKKKQQAFKQEAEKFKEKGQVLLTPTKASQLLNSWSTEETLQDSARADYLPLREKVPGKKGKTWEEVLEKHLPAEAQVVVARGKKTHLLLPMETALAAAKAAGVPLAAPKSKKREEEARIARRQVADAVAAQAILDLKAAVRETKPDKAFWLFLADCVCHRFSYTDRHKLDNEGAVRKHLEKLDEPGLRFAIVEALTLDRLVDYQGNLEEDLQSACSHFGVDLKKLAADHAKKAEPAKKPEPAKK
ncbi:MAG: hypothetical protein KGR26_11420, partial [Cyanobacteria bacterium REEB65]|nr:hypothetical protein [Cyanobacteria bacterium REEB65]